MAQLLRGVGNAMVLKCPDTCREPSELIERNPNRIINIFYIENRLQVLSHKPSTLVG